MEVRPELLLAHLAAQHQCPAGHAAVTCDTLDGVAVLFSTF